MANSETQQFQSGIELLTGSLSGTSDGFDSIPTPAVQTSDLDQSRAGGIADESEGHVTEEIIVPSKVTSKCGDLDNYSDYAKEFIGGSSRSSGWAESKGESSSRKAETGFVTHISESRHSSRKGFETAGSVVSPGLRLMYDTRIKELEEELEIERHARNKLDRQRVDLQREISLLSERLEESADSAHSQVEIARRRELEIQKLQRDLEEIQAQNEVTLTSFRKKHQESVNALTEQIDHLQRTKHRQEKEKNGLRTEADELRGQIDEITKAKLSVEKQLKQQEAQIAELSSKLNQTQKDLTESNSYKNRVQIELSELSKRLEESQAQSSELNKAKSLAHRQIEELKASLDDEGVLKNKTQSEVRSLQVLIEQLKSQVEEEQERYSDLQRQLAKSNGDAAIWKQKFESGEGKISPEEVEDMKKKFVGRIQEVELQLEAVVGKAMGLEKAKGRAQMEIEGLITEVEKAQAVIAQNEKRQRQFDKLAEEWKQKAADLQIQVENAQRDARIHAAETFKFKSQLDETHEIVETLRRENKNLHQEIHDLSDVIVQNQNKIQESEKHARRIETEKEELQVLLEESESTFSQEAGKVNRLQSEISTIKQEMERRLNEKDEEFESIRKTNQRALESMQASLEAETRNKIDALRVKKKLEQDINDLELVLDGVNKGKAEIERTFKKYQQQIRELQQLIDDEQRSRRGTKEEITASERKATLLAGELEEMKTQIDSLERTKKSLEAEVFESADRITELSAANSALATLKKKLEGDAQLIKSELDDKTLEIKITEDLAKKAMTDASRLAEELRQEQQRSSQTDKQRHSLEAQIKDLQARLEVAEAAALQGGRKTIQSLEQRVSELQTELEVEQQKHGETQKVIRKYERRTQELTLQVEEDRKAQDRMHDMIDKMQQKMKGYKKQVEEAEEIAAVNLTKYRKIQHDLEESETRADIAENVIGQLRAKSRASSVSVIESLSHQTSSSSIKSTTTRSNISVDRKIGTRDLA